MWSLPDYTYVNADGHIFTKRTLYFRHKVVVPALRSGGGGRRKAMEALRCCYLTLFKAFGQIEVLDLYMIPSGEGIYGWVVCLCSMPFVPLTLFTPLSSMQRYNELQNAKRAVEGLHGWRMHDYAILVQQVKVPKGKSSLP